MIKVVEYSIKHKNTYSDTSVDYPISSSRSPPPQGAVAAALNSWRFKCTGLQVWFWCNLLKTIIKLFTSKSKYHDPDSRSKIGENRFRFVVQSIFSNRKFPIVFDWHGTRIFVEGWYHWLGLISMIEYPRWPKFTENNSALSVFYAICLHLIFEIAQWL